MIVTATCAGCNFLTPCGKMRTTRQGTNALHSDLRPLWEPTATTHAANASACGIRAFFLRPFGASFALTAPLTFDVRVSNKGRRKSPLSSSARKGGFYPGKPGCRHEHRGRRPGDRKLQLPPHSLLGGTTSSRSRSRTGAERVPASAVDVRSNEYTTRRTATAIR